MRTKNDLRQRLIDKIKRLSDEKLNSLDQYIKELENELKVKSDILSSSGIFKDLDKETMDNLTINLPNRILKGTSRIR